MTILPSPPKEWKRPAIPTKVKLQVILNQDGQCKASGERLGTVANVNFDHRPGLWERKFDTAAWDTVPPANDPAFIEAITVSEHDKRTNGIGGTRRITSAGSDTHRRAKADRLNGTTPKRAGKSIPKRANPWPRKGSRKISSRGFEKRP